MAYQSISMNHLFSAELAGVRYERVILSGITRPGSGFDPAKYAALVQARAETCIANPQSVESSGNMDERK